MQVILPPFHTSREMARQWVSTLFSARRTSPQLTGLRADGPSGCAPAPRVE